MSAPPAGVLAAIAVVSHTVMCVDDCYTTLEVRYSGCHDAIVIRHPNPSCDCVSDPTGPAAVALARFVDEELGRYVSLAHYGEDMPVSVYAGVS